MSFQKSRIAKLERIHRTGDELFYLVWDMDEVSAKAMLVEAREAGQVGDEDLAVCAVWPHDGAAGAAMGDAERDAV
jgi:hypothetical protein